jgi:Phosphohydrolase-associated domain
MDKGPNGAEERYRRLQLVTDYVAGMTDSFAVSLHTTLFSFTQLCSMVDEGSQYLAKRLRTGFSRFLSRCRLTDPLLFSFFQILVNQGWNTVIFGGVIRDLVTGFSRSDLCDIDLVVDQPSHDELLAICAPLVKEADPIRRTTSSNRELAG